MQIKLLICSFVLLVSATLTAKAQRVVYVCPPGTYESSFFGLIECKPLDGSSERSGRTSSRTPRTDPMISKVLGVSSMLQSISTQMNLSMNDPKNQETLKGHWTFTGDKPDEFCSAMFMRQGVWVSIFEPGGDVPGAFLMFWSSTIPKPGEFSKIQATLEQTGEKPQTVNVFNLKFDLKTKEKVTLGALFFQIPTIEAALNGIEDIHNFAVSTEGKKVFAIEWKDGFAARDKLKQCVERKNVKKRGRLL